MNTIEKINSFFMHDMNIKNAFIRLSLDDDYKYDEHYVEMFVRNAYEDLKYVFQEFNTIMDTLNINSYLKNYVIESFEKIEEEFAECGFNPDKLKDFYNKCISHMNPTLLADISQNLSGYRVMRDEATVIYKTTTLNELLHVLHASVVNNDLLLKSCDLLDKKARPSQGYNNACTELYGEEFPLARYVYDNITNDVESDVITILSVNPDNVLIMTRDLGHATSFEIDDYGDYIMVHYFIPKLCNIELINKLHGINPVKPSATTFQGATGRFETTKDQLMNDINGVLVNIPDDIRMHRTTLSNDVEYESHSMGR